jgi:putative inorganic carbon (HCO3(-)) transporter
MAPPDRRPLWIAVCILAATLIWLPWAAGGRSPAGQAGVVLLLALAGAAGFLARGTHPIPAAFPWLALVAVLVGASAVRTMYPDRTAQALVLLAAYTLAVTVAARGARTAPQMERVLLDAGALSGLVVVLLGLVWLSRGNDGGFYANALIGPFGYPNALAGFLLLVGGAAAATLQRDRSRLERSLALLAAAACVIGLYFTRSRGVWVAAAVGCFTWALVQRNRWRPSHWLWMALAAFGVLVGLALAGNRLGTLLHLIWPSGGAGPADTSVQWRLSVLQWTWEMIRDHPWLGVGPGAFPVALLHYQRIPYVGGENPHNLYAEVAAEYGLPLAILATLGLLIYLVRAARAIQRIPLADPVHDRRAALLAAVVAFAVHSATDLDWSYPAIALLAAVLLGLLAADTPAPSPLATPHAPLWRASVLLVLTIVAGLALTRYYSGMLVSLGRDAMAAGSVLTAERYLDQARLLNPLSSSALYWLAWAKRQLGDPAGATEAADRAVRIAPEDPNTSALAGEIALTAGRWETAMAHFQRAVDRAPAAHLRFHAGLLDAAAAGGKTAVAVQAYTRAVSLFTDERVLGSEARCLAPADRYLLARMSRLVARLSPADSGAFDRGAALARAARLAQPDPRGICATGGRAGQTSPEAAVASVWRAWSEGGQAAVARYLFSEPRPNPPDPTSGALPERSYGGRFRVAWIYSLSGGPSQATVVYQVERVDGDDPGGRCARTDTRFTPDGWFLMGLPILDTGPCRP